VSSLRPSQSVSVGDDVGFKEVGDEDGLALGVLEGEEDGEPVGLVLGINTSSVGDLVGENEGLRVGCVVGLSA
jgi:hypothetical protein